MLTVKLPDEQWTRIESCTCPLPPSANQRYLSLVILNGIFHYLSMNPHAVLSGSGQIQQACLSLSSTRRITRLTSADKQFFSLMFILFLKIIANQHSKSNLDLHQKLRLLFHHHNRYILHICYICFLNYPHHNHYKSHNHQNSCVLF